MHIIKNAVELFFLFRKSHLCNNPKGDRRVGVTVKEAAERLGKSQPFVRIGLQRGLLPIGTAIKMSSKWTYHISEKKLVDYNGDGESDATQA